MSSDLRCVRVLDVSVGLFNIDYDDVIPRNVHDRFICYFLITSFTVLTKIPNFCGRDLISVNVKYFCLNVHKICVPIVHLTKISFFEFIVQIMTRHEGFLPKIRSRT